MDNQKQHTPFWALKPEDLERQVNEYDTLRFLHTSRGATVLAVTFSLCITILLSFTGLIGKDTYIYALVLYAPLAFFVARGHRWASGVLMAMWTLDKVVQVAASPKSLIGVIIWWVLFMTVFYRSYQVETERKRRSIPPAPHPLPPVPPTLSTEHPGQQEQITPVQVDPIKTEK